jgi:hypothetical protein
MTQQPRCLQLNRSRDVKHLNRPRAAWFANAVRILSKQSETGAPAKLDGIGLRQRQVRPPQKVATYTSGRIFGADLC